LAPWLQKLVPIPIFFRAGPTKGFYTLPCPGVIYLAQVLVWALSAPTRPLPYIVKRGYNWHPGARNWYLYVSFFRVGHTRGFYTLPCPGIIYLAQVLVWVLGALT
jgi:hypothetical protein